MDNDSIVELYRSLASNQKAIMNMQNALYEMQNTLHGVQTTLVGMQDFMYKLDQKIDNAITEIRETKEELHNEIQDVRTELNDKIENVKSELTEKIENVKSELTEKIEKVSSKLNTKIEKVDNNLSIFKDDVSDFFVNDIIPYINPNHEKRISYLESIAEAHGYARVCENEEFNKYNSK